MQLKLLVLACLKLPGDLDICDFSLPQRADTLKLQQHHNTEELADVIVGSLSVVVDIWSWKFPGIPWCYFSQSEVSILCCAGVNSLVDLLRPTVPCFLPGLCKVLPIKLIKWHIPFSKGALFLEPCKWCQSCCCSVKHRSELRHTHTQACVRTQSYECMPVKMCACTHTQANAHTL